MIQLCHSLMVSSLCHTCDTLWYTFCKKFWDGINDNLLRIKEFVCMWYWKLRMFEFIWTQLCHIWNAMLHSDQSWINHGFKFKNNKLTFVSCYNLLPDIVSWKGHLSLSMYVETTIYFYAEKNTFFSDATTVSIDSMVFLYNGFWG